MFWSAVLDLKTQRGPARSYGSFSRPLSSSTSASSFHIPQSIPEHHPVSHFTSPVPDRFRIEEYVERPDTALARARASLHLSEYVQTALKLLLQGEREAKAATASVQPDLNSRSKGLGDCHGPERTPLLKPSPRAHVQEAATPHEKSPEHNYWMQELERRRAGLRKSRRRTCASMSERATMSPLKVGVVMCSVPLVLVLGFVLFVVLSGNESGTAMEVLNNLLGIGHPNSARHDYSRSARPFDRSLEGAQEDGVNAVMALDVATRLRGVEAESESEMLRDGR